MLVAAVQSPPTVGRCFTVSGAHPPPGSSDLAAVLVAAVQSPPAVGRCFRVREGPHQDNCGAPPAFFCMTQQSALLPDLQFNVLLPAPLFALCVSHPVIPDAVYCIPTNCLLSLLLCTRPSCPLTPTLSPSMCTGEQFRAVIRGAIGGQRLVFRIGAVAGGGCCSSCWVAA